MTTSMIRLLAFVRQSYRYAGREQESQLVFTPSVQMPLG